MATSRKPAPSGISGVVLSTVFGLMATLITTGIIASVTLYTRVAVLTDDVQRTSQTLTKHLEHAVDKGDYDREMSDMKLTIRQMATKDDLHEMRDALLDKIQGHK